MGIDAAGSSALSAECPMSGSSGGRCSAADRRWPEAAKGTVDEVADGFLILPIMLGNGYLIDWWAQGGATVLAKEHSLLEVLEVGLMIPTLALFVFAYRASTGAARVAAGALAMLLAAGVVRELDVKSWGGPNWFQWLTHHGLQEVLFVTMTLPIFAYVFAKRRYIRGLVRLGMRPQAWPLYVAGVLLAGSVIMDRHIVVGDELRFWEELIELNGYFFLLMAACRHTQLVVDPVHGQGPQPVVDGSSATLES